MLFLPASRLIRCTNKHIVQKNKNYSKFQYLCLIYFVMFRLPYRNFNIFSKSLSKKTFREYLNFSFSDTGGYFDFKTEFLIIACIQTLKFMCFSMFVYMKIDVSVYHRFIMVNDLYSKNYLG